MSWSHANYHHYLIDRVAAGRRRRWHTKAYPVGERRSWRAASGKDRECNSWTCCRSDDATEVHYDHAITTSRSSVKPGRSLWTMQTAFFYRNTISPPLYHSMINCVITPFKQLSIGLSICPLLTIRLRSSSHHHPSSWLLFINRILGQIRKKIKNQEIMLLPILCK